MVQLNRIQPTVEMAPMWMLWGKITEQNREFIGDSILNAIRGVVKGQEALVVGGSWLGFLRAETVPDNITFLLSDSVRDATDEQQQILDETEWVEWEPPTPAKWTLWGRVTEQNRVLIGSPSATYLRGVVKGREVLVTGGTDFLFNTHKYYLMVEDVPDDMAFLTSGSVADATEEQQRILDDTEWLEEDPRKGQR